MEEDEDQTKLTAGILLVGTVLAVFVPIAQLALFNTLWSSAIAALRTHNSLIHAFKAKINFCCSDAVVMVQFIH